MHPYVIDLKGAAELIDLNSATMTVWAQEGKVPATKIAGQWRFWLPSLLPAVVGEEARAYVPKLPNGFVEPGVIGVPQLSEFLGVSERKIITMLQDGQIPGNKVGRPWKIFWPLLRDRLAAGQPLKDPPV